MHKHAIKQSKSLPSFRVVSEVTERQVDSDVTEGVITTRSNRMKFGLPKICYQLKLYIHNTTRNLKLLVAVQYDEVEHKIQSLPHPSATADMIWQEQQEDINLVAHSFRYRYRRYSVAHSFRIFLGIPKLPCFFNFPVSRARPEKLCDFYWMQLRITRKSGCIAQAEKSILRQQETAAVRPFSSLRSKRFQSCYCAKVRAAFPSFPSPSPVNHFFFALVPIFSTNSRGNAFYAG